MDTDELLQIVRAEGLDVPVLYDVGDRQEDAVVVERKSGEWLVFVVDGHGRMIATTLRRFRDETRALWRALRRLRQIAEARRSHAALPDHAGSRRSVDFAPRSIDTGAALPVDGAWVVASVEARLTELASMEHRHDQWLADEVPLLARGAAWIVPLSWEPPLSKADDAPWPTPGDRASQLWIDVVGACGHRHGNQIGIDLDPRAARNSGYASQLVRTGARRADWWELGDSALVLVVYGDPVPAPKSYTAVHVIPIGWVSERRPTKRMPAVDLTWSWADVVELGRVDAAPPSGAVQ